MGAGVRVLCDDWRPRSCDSEVQRPNDHFLRPMPFHWMVGGEAALGLLRLRPAETFWGWLMRGLTLVLAHAMLSAVPVNARSHAGGGRLCMVAREDLRTAR